MNGGLSVYVYVYTRRTSPLRHIRRKQRHMVGRPNDTGNIKILEHTSI